MSDWSLGGGYPSCSFHPYPYYPNPEIQQVPKYPPRPPPPPPTHAQPTLPPTLPVITRTPRTQAPKGPSSRETRNRAEKQRRDKMTQSIYRLASMVPPVAASGKKVDKTSVLRLTAHFLRSHHHVFGKSLYRGQKFTVHFTRSFLKSMKGFLVTSTYKGLVVVVSPNVQEFLGYTECELLGQSLFSIVHPEDHQLLRQQLFPRCCRLTSNGELFLSKEIDSDKSAAEALKNEKRAFLLRIRKQTHLRAEPVQYLTCHVDGMFRKSDRAGVYVDTVVQIGRRVRSRGNNPYASGNDIVFIGMIRPISETFATESRMEYYTMEYRTRHSIDGSIIQCEHRIALVTGYMVDEVRGVNAMNFMHRDDVRWVIVALREMYVSHRLMGESCYRLMTKNGQFIYMRTRGALEVDPTSQATTSFVCTNTLVPEKEGIELIRIMKNKFSLKINNEELKDECNYINPEVNDNHLPVEDPRQLEQVIYHLVTDLPSQQLDENNVKNRDNTRTELAIIPPKKDQIKKAIQKSYSIIKNLRNLTENMSSNAEKRNPAKKARSKKQRVSSQNKQKSSTLPPNDSVIRQNRSTVIQPSIPIIEIVDDWDMSGPSTSTGIRGNQRQNVIQPSWNFDNVCTSTTQEHTADNITAELPVLTINPEDGIFDGNDCGNAYGNAYGNDCGNAYGNAYGNYCGNAYGNPYGNASDPSHPNTNVIQFGTGSCASATGQCQYQTNSAPAAITEPTEANSSNFDLMPMLEHIMKFSALNLNSDQIPDIDLLENFPEDGEALPDEEAEAEPLDQFADEQLALFQNRSLNAFGAGSLALLDAGPLTDFLPRPRNLIDPGFEDLQAAAQAEMLAEFEAQLALINRPFQFEARPQGQNEDGLQDEAAAVMEVTQGEIEMSEIQRLQVAAIIDELSDPFRFSEADEEPI